jgi:hypothetical protein
MKDEKSKNLELWKLGACGWGKPIFMNKPWLASRKVPDFKTHLSANRGKTE